MAKLTAQEISEIHAGIRLALFEIDDLAFCESDEELEKAFEKLRAARKRVRALMNDEGPQ